MISPAQISKLIPRAFKSKTHIENGATVDNIIKSIQAATPLATQQSMRFAKYLQGQNREQTLLNIWQVLQMLKYNADGFNLQNIKQPSALMHTREGDCKSYALFTAGVCNALGIPVKYIVAQYEPTKNNKTKAHIYCQSGNTIIDGTLPQFNYEAPNPINKKTYNTMTKVVEMAGAQVGSPISQTVITAFNIISNQLNKGLVKFSENENAIKNLRKLSTGQANLLFTGALKAEAKLFFRGIRFLILLAIRYNVNGIATVWQKGMTTAQRKPFERVFYAFGGNTQMALWAAINHGSREPVLKVTDFKSWLSAQAKAIATTNELKFQGGLKDAWRFSAIGIPPEIAAGGTTGAAAVIAFISSLIDFAQTPEGQKILDKIPDAGTKNKTPEGSEGGSNTATSNNLSTIAPLAILFALGS